MIAECWSALPEYLNATVVKKSAMLPACFRFQTEVLSELNVLLEKKSVHCGYCGTYSFEVSVNELSRENRFDI